MVAILLVCPGQNGDGEQWLREQPGWVAMAERRQIGVHGLAFASPEADLQPEVRRGYFYMESGSDRKLLSELDAKFGRGDKRLLIFGYSGGAHFAHRFTHKHPDKVIAWCAYSAGWWDDPPVPKVKTENVKGKNDTRASDSGDSQAVSASARAIPGTPKTEPRRPSVSYPPGLVLCGLNDEPRRTASIDYFLKCRDNGLPVCWAGLPDSGHEVSPAARTFCQNYLEAVLRLERSGRRAPLTRSAWEPAPPKADGTPEYPGPGVWVRVPAEADSPRPVAGWLPDLATAKAWSLLTHTRLEIVGGDAGVKSREAGKTGNAAAEKTKRPEGERSNVLPVSLPL